ncbi:hypothetical protein CDAR_107711 [Caerostris darwini]|uniref:Uncharacterized protein n=1 Tax=Caerostris darwini TaxID=1538125 RepID=A0AAV4PBD5_9ARAC|nr:hypothetical protein CDAR_107711 [Caerostris darwini]
MKPNLLLASLRGVESETKTSANYDTSSFGTYPVFTLSGVKATDCPYVCSRVFPFMSQAGICGLFPVLFAFGFLLAEMPVPSKFLENLGMCWIKLSMNQDRRLWAWRVVLNEITMLEKYEY